MKKLMGLFAGLVLFVGLLPHGAQGAGAGLLYRVFGTVSDREGSPLAGALISDVHGMTADRYTMTDANGNFAFDAIGVGCEVPLLNVPRCTVLQIVIDVSLSGFATKRVSVPVEKRLESQDVRLGRVVSAGVTPWLFSSTPQTLRITGYSSAPKETCLTFTDATSDSQIPLTATDRFSGESRLWEGSLLIPEGLMPAQHFYTVTITNCSTGIELGDAWSHYYILDAARPMAEVTSPKEGHQYLGDVDAGPSHDGETHIAGPHTFSAQLTDDVGLRNASLSLYFVDDTGYEYFVDSCYFEDLGGAKTFEASCQMSTWADRINTQWVLRIRVGDLAFKSQIVDQVFYLTPF